MILVFLASAVAPLAEPAPPIGTAVTSPPSLRLELVPKLTVQGVPGSTSVVERAEQLSGPWTAWTNVVIHTEGSVLVDLSPGASTRFYRAVGETRPGIPEGFVWIPPGTFTMGSPVGEPFRDPTEIQRRVTLTQGFWLSDHEVTRKEYLSIMGDMAGPIGVDSNLPIDSATWRDAVAYCQRLTERERAAGRITAEQEYRLPTEAEWEYAARAGTNGVLYGDVHAIAWHAGNSQGRVRPGKQKIPNAWGLYDLFGNVSEWCADWVDLYRAGDATDPRGPETPPKFTDGILATILAEPARVIRGGNSASPPESMRSAGRSFGRPDIDAGGFRPVLGSAGKPVIFSAPLPRLVSAGGPVELAAFAGGRSPLTYQWQFNRTNLVGATQATLLISFVQPFHAGNYRVVVSNALGVATSAEAKLSVETSTLGRTGFVWIPPGTFTMGSPKTEVNRGVDEVEHPVTLTRGFWLLDHEVTQSEYLVVMGSNPSMNRGDSNLPVDMVQWTDAMEYCRRLTERERAAGRISSQEAYRLPTEAEWEYAARAGTTGPRHGELTSIGWWKGNTSGEGTRPVKQKLPNAWGLHDMIGNVGEWCADWYAPYPSGPATDPTGAVSGDSRVYRGGGWHSDDFVNRSATRGRATPDSRYFSVGFRPALSEVR